MVGGWVDLYDREWISSCWNCNTLEYRWSGDDSGPLTWCIVRSDWEGRVNNERVGWEFKIIFFVYSDWVVWWIPNGLKESLIVESAYK